MVERTDPAHHDRVLAIVSHLPHLLAFTICGTADDLEDESRQEVLRFAASGFRDFTRIAASDPVMWRDVFLNNREVLLEMLARFTENTFVKLRAAVMGTSGDDLPRLRAAAPKVVEAAKAVRSVLETSEQVQVCDDNPFGVTVRIVGTLVPAVSELIRLGTGLLAA